MSGRILMVDDEPHVLEAWRRMLRAHRQSWHLSFAHSGQEALDQLMDHGADLVVSDVRMPGMTGLDLLQRIQQSDQLRHIPVVIVTGISDRSLKGQALELGAADLLSKPVDAAELVARLRNTLRLKQQQDQLKASNKLLQEKVEERTRQLAASRLDIIWRLAKAAEFRDKDTGNHVVRVGYYSRILAEALGLDRDFCESIFLASPLHDIGKIAIPDAILRKRGKLTPHEWEIMKQHCTIGANFLRQNPGQTNPFALWDKPVAQPPGGGPLNPLLQTAAVIALTHHERWDGSGYPHGLAGESIPLEGRIVAVTDCFDALSTKRPYKPAFPEHQVRSIIEAEAGQHFDPDIVDVFLSCQQDLRDIAHRFCDQSGDEPQLQEVCAV